MKKIEDDTVIFRKLEKEGLFELKPLAARHRLVGGDTKQSTGECSVERDLSLEKSCLS